MNIRVIDEYGLEQIAKQNSDEKYIILFTEDYYAFNRAYENTISSILIANQLNWETYKLLCNREDDVCKEYAIEEIPTIILFENGKSTTRLVGLNTASALQTFLLR